ncbi:MAG: 50S ribosomal protein L29 [Acidobacteria bacterium]|nr:50S ribosomal protein L29 [Acidobacteriota bacterium]
MKARLEAVRQLSSEDLAARIAQIKESLFRLNFKKALGDNETVGQIRSQKRELARLKTLLRGRALGIEK